MALKAQVVLTAGMLILGLAGCGGPSIYGESPRSDKIESMYSYGAAGRDLALRVYGNPFPAVPAATFSQSVAANVQDTGWLPPTHPTLTPGPTARPPFKLVMVFEPPPTASADAVCAERAMARPTTDPIEVLAAFCHGDRPITYATGQMARTASPDDPAFHTLMTQLMLSLFRRDPYERDQQTIGLIRSMRERA